MIVKKKRLYLGLLVSILGIGNVMQAAMVQIKNSTPYPIRYQIGRGQYNNSGELEYYKKIEGEIDPENIAKIGRVAGLLIFVKAWVKRSGRPEVEAKPFKTGEHMGETTWWNGTHRGDNLFVVSGSDETGYTVKFRRSK